MRQDTKEVVRLAKHWLAELYSEEGIADIGLEEVRTDNENWEITLGFVRPFANKILEGINPTYRPTGRLYKILRISDSDKTVIEMRNREAA